MHGDLVHMASVAGDAACHPHDRRPRVTSDVRLVTCEPCRQTRRFNGRLRHWLLRWLREDREAIASGVLHA
jgi:hypothetical protein